MTTSSPDSSTHAGDHKLIRANRVENVKVFDGVGEQMGHIDDLAIDRVTGQVVYAIMSFGGFLGMGKMYHPLPWELLHYDRGMGGYIVNLDKAALQQAPQYTAEDLVVFDGHEQPAHSKTIYDYYNIPFAW